VGRSTLQHSRSWTAIACAVVCVHLLVSLVVPRGFALTAFGDILQNAVLLCATIAFLTNIRGVSSKAGLFWGLMGLGLSMWLISQVMWTYIEVYLRHEAPNPFVGDVILFLHIVPMMAAVAVQPHLQHEDSRTIHAGTLDFALLLTWWLFLYLFVVIPWQYVHPVESIYGRSFDLLYVCEEFVLAVGLILVWRRSEGAWRTIYFNLCGATLLYCIASLEASEAIDKHIYYTGSLFDVPLVASMLWFIRIGFLPLEEDSTDEARGSRPRGHGIWKARLSMIAVFVTPLMIAWAQFGNVPKNVRTYRLLLTVATMIVMGALVFFKQHLLDQELLSLLRLSRSNLDEMCRLKDELENKEHSLRWHSLELQRKNLELQEISFTDALTRIWNRRYLEEILTAEAGQVLRNYQRARGADIRKLDHRDLVFIMVDVDFFKEVNDQHGHAAGDRLLELVAQRLSSVVRKSDVLVRWGGEEFLIMSRSTDPSGTPAFCSRVLEVMSFEPFDLGQGVVVRKTCSVGWAPYPWCRNAFESICAEEAIELADIALYRAKALGRNQGIGLLPSDSALASSEVDLVSVREPKSPLVRVLRTSPPNPLQNFEEEEEPTKPTKAANPSSMIGD